MTSDLTKLLQSAAKGKAPVVAIPIEGHAPVCLPRKRLAAWMKGVTVHKVDLVSQPDEWFFVPGEKMYGDWITNDEGKREYRPCEGPLNVSCDHIPGERKLKITGVVESKGLAYSSPFLIKTSCTMFVIDRRTAMLEIHKWSQKERESNLKVIAQGATGAAALKEAKKAAKAKERAAKLLQMEKGGSSELEDAVLEERSILAQARRHGRGPDKKQAPSYEIPEDTAAKLAEKTVRHVSHHNVSHRVRKTAAVIRFRMKALKTEWYDVTKFNPQRRKSTANKFFKVKKSIRIIQIVKDCMALKAKLLSILPECIPNPRWQDEDHRVFWINPLDRPDAYKRKDVYEYHDHYDRAGLARRLREARETIRVLTPPPDSEEMDVAA